MDNIPGWKVFSAGIGIAGLMLVGYFIYQWQFETADDLKPLQREAVENALEELAGIYRENVKQQGAQRLVVMPVRHDTSGDQIREMLFAKLNGLDGVKAAPPRDPDLEERAGSIFNSLIGGDSSDEPDPAKVFESAAEADEVLTIDVTKLWSGADSGICKLSVYRIVRADDEKRTPKVAQTRLIRGLSGTAVAADEEPSAPGFWSSAWGFLWRALVVGVGAFFLPFLAWPVAKAVLRQDNNLLNAALLILLTAIGLLILFATVGFSLEGREWSVMLSAGLLLPLSLLYNLAALNYIEQR